MENSGFHSSKSRSPRPLLPSPLPPKSFETMVVVVVVVVSFAFLFIFFQNIPTVVSHELILPDSIPNLGNISRTCDGTLEFNLSSSVIHVNCTPGGYLGNITLKGKIDDFCGVWQKTGLGVVLLLIVVPVVVLAIYTHLRRARDDRLLGDAMRALPGMPREFRFVELSQATGGFAEGSKLGEGGFGKVYKGVLPEGGVEVAVKSFSRETSRADFLAELTVINRLRHRNLVGLLGWCYKNKKLLLVYVYMPNGSLDKHLYGAPLDYQILPWERRYNILAGVASALHYLHNEYDQKVIHRDIKSSNIMLDSSFNACLGDFGLARAINEEQTSYEEHGAMPGTWGYIAPECLHTGKATGKSDVFSFGAVVLEVLCGRRPGTPIGGFRFLVDWVWTMYEEGNILEAVDLRLAGKYNAREMEMLLLLGLACSHPNASERPKTLTILQVISKSIPPPTVPLPKPAFVLTTAMEGEPTTSRMTTREDLYPPSIMYTRSWFTGTPSPNSTGVRAAVGEVELHPKDTHPFAPNSSG